MLYGMVQELNARLRSADLQMITDLKRKNQALAQAYRELQEAQAALVQKERLERELELARELQQTILPRDLPVWQGVSFAARSRSARQVGGDFYDVISLSEGRFGLVRAFCSGVSGRLVCAAARRRAARRALRLRWARGMRGGRGRPDPPSAPSSAEGIALTARYRTRAPCARCRARRR